MKSISLILGFLILALALKPCSDGLNIEHENDTEIGLEHNHQNDHDDSCAMLCVCNCCGMLIISQIPPTFALHAKKIISTQINSHYESNYRFNMLFSIWQPPQFSS